MSSKKSRQQSPILTGGRVLVGVAGLAAYVAFGQFGGAAAAGTGTAAPNGTVALAAAAQPLAQPMPVTGAAPVAPQAAAIPQLAVAPPPPLPAAMPPIAPAVVDPGVMATVRAAQADVTMTQQIMSSVETLNNGKPAGAQAGAQQPPKAAACTMGVVGVLQPVQAELQADLAKLQKVPAQILTNPLGFLAMEVGDAVGLVQKELGEVQAVVAGCPQAAGQQASTAAGQQQAPQATANLTMEQVQSMLAAQVAKMQAGA